MGDERIRGEFQKRLTGSVKQFRILLRSAEDGNVDVHAAGDTVIGGWEPMVKTMAERVVV